MYMLRSCGGEELLEGGEEMEMEESGNGRDKERGEE